MRVNVVAIDHLPMGLRHILPTLLTQVVWISLILCGAAAISPVLGEEPQGGARAG